ncbi:hypothetical protein BDW02DRAFT_107268 [Decorospora gaudefroyi]|uniref:Uncharacterized protein n=1 Tax=Decorospora gaudefroyi TaxID=184978 RepID=A0A6A5KNE1_9PLEO|nr:hypothetical protein BDW02DRAFT_107268 [Decorospora gaudefroyi]
MCSFIPFALCSGSDAVRIPPSLRVARRRFPAEDTTVGRHCVYIHTRKSTRDYSKRMKRCTWNHAQSQITPMPTRSETCNRAFPGTSMPRLHIHCMVPRKFELPNQALWCPLQTTHYTDRHPNWRTLTILRIAYHDVDTRYQIWFLSPHAVL